MLMLILEMLVLSAVVVGLLYQALHLRPKEGKESNSKLPAERREKRLRPELQQNL